jgi:hypothetical protein
MLNHFSEMLQHFFQHFSLCFHQHFQIVATFLGPIYFYQHFGEILLRRRRRRLWPRKLMHGGPRWPATLQHCASRLRDLYGATRWCSSTEPAPAPREATAGRRVAAWGSQPWCVATAREEERWQHKRREKGWVLGFDFIGLGGLLNKLLVGYSFITNYLLNRIVPLWFGNCCVVQIGLSPSK